MSSKLLHNPAVLRRVHFSNSDHRRRRPYHHPPNSKVFILPTIFLAHHEIQRWLSISPLPRKKNLCSPGPPSLSSSDDGEEENPVAREALRLYLEDEVGISSEESLKISSNSPSYLQMLINNVRDMEELELSSFTPENRPGSSSPLFGGKVYKMAKQKGDRGLLPYLESLSLSLSSVSHLACQLSSHSLQTLICQVKYVKKIFFSDRDDHGGLAGKRARRMMMYLSISGDEDVQQTLSFFEKIGLERGFLNAVKDFVLMQLQLAAVFFTFSFGSKAHYYGRTILHGGAKYRPTGRKVVVFHASFTENYRLYSRSHFVKGFEILILLVVYYLFRRSYENNVTYVLVTYAIWFMSMTWLFAPFLFNPSGFNWGKVVDDWKDWNKWIIQQGGIGIQQDKSWYSWWLDEQDHLRHARLASRFIEILLSLRFFLYQYGLVYHLDISGQNKNFIVYVLSWVVIVAIFLLVKVVNLGRRRFSATYQLAFRLFKVILFLVQNSVVLPF